MGYIGGKCVCDFCGKKFRDIILSSLPFQEMKKDGWKYRITERLVPVEKKIIHHRFIIKESDDEFKIEHQLEIKCDICQRMEKINKIKLKMGG